MIQTMYEAPGVGLAANQVGVQKRLFVYDVGEGPGVVINPVLTDLNDEWIHHEGCLSVPDLWWDIGRAKEVRLTGLDLDDNELDIEADAELGVVVAFGRLIKPHVLAALPMVNIHFSVLPRWRGAAPLERAILAGDTETGVCLMQLEEGLDTGPVYDCVRVPIGPDDTAVELRERLVEAGTDLLVTRLRDGLGTPMAQEGETTYADKVAPEEHRLDW